MEGFLLWRVDLLFGGKEHLSFFRREKQVLEVFCENLPSSENNKLLHCWQKK
jgi:hypothetical protein